MDECLFKTKQTKIKAGTLKWGLECMLKQQCSLHIQSKQYQLNVIIYENITTAILSS